jgi:hypothetical protein
MARELLKVVAIASIVAGAEGLLFNACHIGEISEKDYQSRTDKADFEPIQRDGVNMYRLKSFSENNGFGGKYVAIGGLVGLLATSRVFGTLVEKAGEGKGEEDSQEYRSYTQTDVITDGLGF